MSNIATVATESLAPSQALDSHATPAVVSPAALAGTYTNIDHATRDIVKLVIAVAGTGITVHAFGACSPTPCDWGSVSGLAYAANVSSSPAIAFSAAYRFSFSQVILTGRVQGKQLIVDAFTHFTDGSGRSDYYMTNVMAK